MFFWKEIFLKKIFGPFWPKRTCDANDLVQHRCVLARFGCGVGHHTCALGHKECVLVQHDVLCAFKHEFLAHLVAVFGPYMCNGIDLPSGHIAQLVELVAVTCRVAGSIPTLTTCFCSVKKIAQKFNLNSNYSAL